MTAAATISCLRYFNLYCDVQSLSHLPEFYRSRNVGLCAVTPFQLLDCFVIPVLMVLSWFFLKTRYRLVHFVAVGMCLLGVGAMVGADILAGREKGSSEDTLPKY